MDTAKVLKPFVKDVSSGIRDLEINRVSNELLNIGFIGSPLCTSKKLPHSGSCFHSFPHCGIIAVEL